MWRKFNNERIPYYIHVYCWNVPHKILCMFWELFTIFHASANSWRYGVIRWCHWENNHIGLVLVLIGREKYVWYHLKFHVKFANFSKKINVDVGEYHLSFLDHSPYSRDNLKHILMICTEISKQVHRDPNGIWMLHLFHPIGLWHAEAREKREQILMISPDLHVLYRGAASFE